MISLAMDMAFELSSGRTGPTVGMSCGTRGGAAQDQIALPVPGHRPVLDLRWALTDTDHVAQAAPALIGTPLGFTQRSTGTQTGVQFTAQISFALHVN